MFAVGVALALFTTVTAQQTVSVGGAPGEAKMLNLTSTSARTTGYGPVKQLLDHDGDAVHVDRIRFICAEILRRGQCIGVEDLCPETCANITSSPVVATVATAVGPTKLDSSRKQSPSSSALARATTGRRASTVIGATDGQQVLLRSQALR